ncbi:MMPL family transporter [Nocardioides halotolerans]|uniref:MMPL family transporter n=1 Tax=Nocardioides halotolerans TaxID=433660 RepID=UPI000421C9AC|nr:MMPL family transporter [Nocardioides halotolerans]
MLQFITSWSYRHRWLVVVAWIAVLVTVNVAGSALGGESKQEFLSPGTDSKAAAELLDARFPARAGDTVAIVVHDDRGVASDDVHAVVGPVVDRFRDLPHVVDVVSPWDAAGAAQVSADGATAYAVVQLDSTGARFPVEVASEMVDLAADARAGGVQLELSGQAIENVQSSSMGAEGPGLAIAALILLLAFGSLVATGLPLATALFGVGIGLAGGRLMANVVDVPEWASSVAIMIGLGVGIDYALLILTRYRGELGAGADPSAAAATAMATAGRSVVFAGVTVVISLLGMLTMNQPYVPGVAFSAVLTVGAVMLAALTLLPALIGLAGRGVDRLRIPWPRRAPTASGAGFWRRYARVVQRRPVLAALAAVAALGVLIVPVKDLHLGYPDDGNDPTSLTTRRAYDLMTDGFGAGFNGAFVLVADRGDASALADLGRLGEVLGHTPGVAAVSPPVAAPGGDAALITLTPTTSPQDGATKRLLARLRAEVVPDVMAGSDVVVKVGGITAADVDQTNSIQGRLPLFIAAVILLALLLLVAVFRSVVVAAQAAASNLLSIAAAYGVVAYAAQGGWLGDLVGITTPTPIPAFIPMMMFAILFGLSMDYEVFLLSRIREEHLRGRDNAAAVTEGLASTGKVITAAALIMAAVFGAFVLDDEIFLKIIGIGMAAAVLVDAVVIRLLLVPAVMQLVGERNWWIPGRLDRLLPALDIEGPTTSRDEPARPAPTFENA